MATTDLTPQEQQLFDFAVSALPSWFVSIERQREDLFASAKTMGAAQAIQRFWFDQALITKAVGPQGGGPDWLGQHAIDRGTRRQAGESDPALRDRLRNVSDALTRGALLAATNAILKADGLPQTAAIVELPRDAAYLGRYFGFSKGHGTFVGPDANGDMRYTPASLPWRTPPVDGTQEGWAWLIQISNAQAAGNNVSTVVLRMDGDAAVYHNPSGVSGEDLDPSVDFDKLRWGNVPADQRLRTYIGRGYRMNSQRAAIILILPFGTGQGTQNSVLAMLTQKKAAGVAARVERRMVP